MCLCSSMMSNVQIKWSSYCRGSKNKCRVILQSRVKCSGHVTPGLWDSIDNWLLFTLFMMTNMLRCFVEIMLKHYYELLYDE